MDFLVFFCDLFFGIFGVFSGEVGIIFLGFLGWKFGQKIWGILGEKRGILSKNREISGNKRGIL